MLKKNFGVKLKHFSKDNLFDINTLQLKNQLNMKNIKIWKKIHQEKNSIDNYLRILKKKKNFFKSLDRRYF